MGEEGFHFLEAEIEVLHYGGEFGGVSGEDAEHGCALFGGDGGEVGGGGGGGDDARDGDAGGELVV